MKVFVKQSTKGGKCTAFIENYESKITDNVFTTISEESIVRETFVKLLKLMLSM